MADGGRPITAADLGTLFADRCLVDKTRDANDAASHGDAHRDQRDPDDEPDRVDTTVFESSGKCHKLVATNILLQVGLAGGAARSGTRARVKTNIAFVVLIALSRLVVLIVRVTAPRFYERFVILRYS